MSRCEERLLRSGVAISVLCSLFIPAPTDNTTHLTVTPFPAVSLTGSRWRKRDKEMIYQRRQIRYVDYTAKIAINVCLGRTAQRSQRNKEVVYERRKVRYVRDISQITIDIAR